jgi:hypothetical protein
LHSLQRVFQIKHILLYFFEHGFALLLVELLLRPFNETDGVTHAENTLRHAFG